MKAGSHVPHKYYHRQHRTKSQSSQKGKKGETPPTFLDNDLDFMDTVLMGLNSIDADLDRPDDVTNLFNFRHVMVCTSGIFWYQEYQEFRKHPVQNEYECRITK
jgi:hypothetical protein